MPGLVPGIHVFPVVQAKSWMAGTSPAMTANYSLSGAFHFFSAVSISLLS